MAMAVVWRRNAQGVFVPTQAIDFGVRPLLPRTKHIFAQDAANTLPGVPLDGWQRIAPSFGLDDPLPASYREWFAEDNLPTLTLPYADIVHGLPNIPAEGPADLMFDCGKVLQRVLVALAYEQP